MNNRRKDDKSKFIPYCIGCCSVLLVGCLCFVFLYFQTDLIMDVDTAINHKVVDFERTQVSTYLTSRTDKDGDTPGLGDDDPDTPGIQEPEEGATGEPYVPDGSWYTSVPDDWWGSSVNKSTDLQYGMNLYNRIPWSKDSNAYFYDFVQANEDVIDYINTTSGKNSGLATGVGFLHEHSSTSLATVQREGITSVIIALQPSVVDRSYCDNFKYDTWKNRSSLDVSAYTGKGVVVLKNKGGQYMFLPFANVDENGCDAKGQNYTTTQAKDRYWDVKGHTFPGGAIQTHLQLVSYAGNSFNLNVGDAGERDTTFTMSSLVDRLDTTVSSAEPSPLRAYIKATIELYRAPSTFYKPLNENYDIIGFVYIP